MSSVSRKGIFLIICGPAGSGKTTLCEQLMEEFSQIKRIITATTREQRPGEQNGVDYFFFSPEEFEAKIEEGAFYEHANVHGRHYGTLKSEVQKQLNAGTDIILNIDVQGAATFRENAKNDTFLAEKMVTIFIKPDCLDTLRERLRFRQSDSETEIERRMESAIAEMETAELHDYIIPTGDRNTDYRLISSIYLAEKHRVV